MGNQKKLLFFLLLFPFALCVKAGTGKLEGVLHGYVTDAVTKKPLSGVTVSAIVPGTNNLKEVQTDSDGLTVPRADHGETVCRSDNVGLPRSRRLPLDPAVDFQQDLVGLRVIDGSHVRTNHLKIHLVTPLTSLSYQESLDPGTESGNPTGNENQCRLRARISFIA